MALNAARAEILREALASRHREPFERPLGRAVRQHGGDYADYVALVSDLRELAASRHADLREAARALAAQG